MTESVIDRASPTPYYEQLFAILRDRITDGQVLTDERLPSEHELCREFGLSRATVRQTLAKLESEGFARRVARRGMFVSQPEDSSGWTVQDTQGFLELQLRHGRTGVSTDVVEAGWVTPPEHTAQALRTAAGEKVLALERVRSLDRKIAMYSTNWFPGGAGGVIASAADVLDGSGSVTNALRAGGFLVSGAHRVVEALRAPVGVAEHLRITTDDPVLRVRSLSWDSSGARFDYYETWVITGVIPLEIDVSAS